METDLHISHRLRQLLPSLSKDERATLRANIEKAGRVREAIRWWFDGDQKVIVDGMHRWDLLTGTDIPYETEELHFGSYEEAEIWILENQLGRRNLFEPATFRRVLGELYNRTKTPRGGDRTSEKSKGHGVPLIDDAAEKIGKSAGVSAKTVKRAAARVEAMEKLTKSAKIQAEKAPDKDVKALARLSDADQDKVARAVRVGQAETIGEAIKQTGARPEGKKPKQPPKQYGPEDWLKQWHRQIGPVVRFVDNVAKGIGEIHGKNHRTVQRILQAATEEMKAWLKGN